jgi:hypothetical protein
VPAVHSGAGGWGSGLQQLEWKVPFQEVKLRGGLRGHVTEAQWCREGETRPELAEARRYRNYNNPNTARTSENS